MELNVQEMLLKIKETGLTDKAISEVVGLSQPTITRLRNNVIKHSYYNNGIKIKKLYDELTISTETDE